MSASSVEHFPNIPVIPYTPSAPVSNVLCFRHYDANAVIMGKTMQDWLRFAVCYWHTFRGTGADPFGGATLVRKWDGDGSHTIENFKRKMDAAFELFHKLGVKYWTFHDRDIAPEGKTKEETEKNLDIMVDYALELQKKYSVKLLWGTANLFSAAKYMCGAATNPDLRIYAEAAAQIKKAMDVTLKLGGECYVLWGGREGFQSLLNTDIKEELDQFAAFLKMVADYKRKIGANFQLLIEPKPKEPTAHQYDYDAQTVIGFLKTYGLDADYKLNIEPNHTTLAGHEYCHDIIFSSNYNFLGSIDANTGSPNLGWDTDQFCTDVRNTALIMLTVIQQGGLAPGGLNFDAKVRRESNEDEDIFIAHISSMDAFARGLKIAAKIIEDGVMQKLLDARYATWKGEVGQKILQNKMTLEEVAALAGKEEPERKSGKQEAFEAVYAAYLNMNL